MGSYFEPNPFAEADLTSYLCDRVGVGIGTVFSYSPSKIGANATKACANIVSRELTHVATKAIATKVEQRVTSFTYNASKKISFQTSQKSTLIAEKNLAPNLDKLSKAGHEIINPNGLSRAGRALDKHGNRPGSVFSKATGNEVSKNKQAQFYIDDILTHPNSKVRYFNHKALGRVTDIQISDGYGVRFSENGKFIGFLEP